ncbi:hypothetical protein [Wenzhouxiangella sediminis]|nr:hypothetical protein [Wenzhouxiangella sediminis]
MRILQTLLSFVLIAALSTEAEAQPSFNDAVMGYAYVNPAGSLQFDHLYQREGTDVVSLHPLTGVHTVQFHQVVPQGSFVPMASWAGSSTRGCTIRGYGFGLTPEFTTHRWATIHCFDENGNSLNVWHQVMLVDEGSANGNNTKLAFTDSQEALPSGNFLDLSNGSTHNPGGGSTTLTRLGTGQYHVTFNDLGAVMTHGATVQVIPYSVTEPRACRVDDWTLQFAGSNNARVRIHCRGLSGSGLVDSRFVVLLTSTEPSSSTAASAAFPGQSTAATTWTPVSGPDVHNPHGDVEMRWDPGPSGGSHQVRFQWPSDSEGGVVFASPVFESLHNCINSSPHRPSTESADYIYVNVVCLNNDGESSTSSFNLLLTEVSSQPLPDHIFSDRFEP